MSAASNRKYGSSRFTVQLSSRDAERGQALFREWKASNPGAFPTWDAFVTEVLRRAFWSTATKAETAISEEDAS